MVRPPVRTAEQRLASLALSTHSRRVQAATKAQLKAGRLGLAELLERADTDPAIAALPVLTVLQSLPRHGPRRASAALRSLGIAESRRLRGLGPRQRQALSTYYHRPILDRRGSSARG